MSLLQPDIAWNLRLLRLKRRMEKKWNTLTGAEKNVYVWSRVPLYKKLWEGAASELSAQFAELAEGIWEIRNENTSTRIYNHMVQLDDPVILNLAAHKPFCYSMLTASGLPIPQHLIFRLNEFDKAKRFMEAKTGLFVVKPAIGTSAGMGVTTHIKSVSECREAAALASLYSDEIIIERLIPGESYRVLVLGDRVIHASRRSGLRVRGDGQSTLWQLVKKQNERRGELKEDDYLRLLNDDRDCNATLEAQGLSREFIPEAGRDILVKSIACPLRRTDEVRTVYTENVTELLCHDVRRQAIRAAGCLNAQFAGVDILTRDPAVPLEKSGGVINEINTTPGLHHHYDLLNNDGTAAAVLVLKHLLNTSRTAGKEKTV